ncbi:MAG TPA: prolipoprotein diacylglyceryl transferase family protein [Candidatus Limnocylindrales bacterium]|nr:prolipoprotein diacylglyceryl transferase family protein [Candidatus Limnocylindrales bacterium]
MIGVLTLSFDPVVVISDTTSVRLETIALALVLFVGLVLAAWLGRRVGEPALRVDDLIFMVVGSVPGAIVGGRVGYVLDHLAYYQTNPNAIVDPAQGGLTLTLALPFGLLTGAVIGRLLGSPIGRWMHALALPLLFVLAGGKLAGILGGTGQGAPSDLQWATSYAGPGPWGSLAADVPSHPSQVYEAIAIGVAIVALWLVSHVRLISRRDGAAMWAAIALWCVARFVVGFSWRDPAILGALRVEQMLALAVSLVAVAGLAERARAHRRVDVSAQTTPPVDAAPAVDAARVDAPVPARVDAPLPAMIEAPAATVLEAPATLDADAAARAEAEALAEAETPAEGATDPGAAPA